ncbi:MAG: nucleoside deaminase [Puniceicoccales bacterium]|jgi:tRNA(adenine34) deaminase|nr:nucleoside deaminase [Puniceicoccales bacterium]
MSFSSCPFKPFDEQAPNSTEAQAWQIFFMQCAYNLALKAWHQGEIPIGAIAVVNQQIVSRAYNQVEQKKNACAHAEMQILYDLFQQKRDWRLTDVHLYVTKEPCPMCSGAIFKSRVPKVVVGVYDRQQGCLGGCLDFNQHLKLYHCVEVVTEPLNGYCETLLKTFFKLRRNGNTLHLPLDCKA